MDGDNAVWRHAVLGDHVAPGVLADRDDERGLARLSRKELRLVNAPFEGMVLRKAACGEVENADHKRYPHIPGRDERRAVQQRGALRVHPSGGSSQHPPKRPGDAGL